MANDHSDTERRLWDVADEFRANSDLKSSGYATPVLGLIFLRYSDHRFTLAEKELAGKGSGRRKIGKEDYQAKGVMFLPPTARFSHLLSLPEGENIGKAINDAMKAVEAQNEDLKGVLPKTYTMIENSTLVSLLKNFSQIAVDAEGDTFGKIYEYFLGKFVGTLGEYDPFLRLKNQNEAGRYLGEHVDARRLVVECGESPVEASDTGPCRDLAAEKKELTYAEGGLGSVETTAFACAPDVLDFYACPGIGQETCLDCSRFGSSDLPGETLELWIVEKCGLHGILKG